MKNFLIIILVFLFTNNVLSQDIDYSRSFNLKEIEISNPDIKVLIDTILHMDSLCEKSNINYKISIKDTIFQNIGRYIIIVSGIGIFDIDTIETYGCLKYKNRFFFFKKPFIQGIGVNVTDSFLYFEPQKLNSGISDNIPQTSCVYYLGRLWIIGRIWDWNINCGDYEYPIEVLSVIKN